MKILTGKDLLIRQPLNQVRVDLGNDEFVYVREMTGRERDAFEQSLSKEVKTEDGKTEYRRALDDFRAKLAVCVICDENGNLLLKPEDAPTLSANMGIRRLEKIVLESQKLNKISAKDLSDLTKNSEADRDGSSNSGSAEN